MQIISGLQRAGHRVTFSMPLKGYLGKKNLDRVLPLLNKEEFWASEHYSEPHVVLNRIQPDICITCNINTFQPPPSFAKPVVQILDLYGPLQFEGLLLDSPDYEAAMHSSALLEERCQSLVHSLRHIDYMMTVSERQKYFWSAYCTLAGFSFAELNLLVCPAAFDIPQISRNPSPNLSAVYSGGFYPWQNPNRFLEEAATILDDFEAATLHVFGGPHIGLTNEADVQRFLTELQRHRSVQYHGYRPVEEVLAKLSEAWCAFELMERNIERELAITGRTLEFLSTGTPVIYNNYSTLSRLIEQYGAGWTVSVEGQPQLRSIFNQLVEGGHALVNELSANALKLAAHEFSADTAIAPLAELCGSPTLLKRASLSIRCAPAGGKQTRPPRVLAISPAAGTLLDLRLGNPLRALHRQGLVDGITFAGPSLQELRHDRNKYDVILTQRTLPPGIYELLENLSLKFALDVDDNLLARASYRTEDPESGIAAGLRLCTAVSMPNPRLVRALETYTGLPLATKSFITPNALPFAAGTADRTAAPPSQIIWIQSDIAALDRSRREVVSAVERFSDKYALPVVLIGKNVLTRPQFRHQVVMGEIDFTANLQLLATAPLSLGVAPLETKSDPETLDFIAGKSDLKIILFAGYGHAGVYSAAPPYTDSNLQNGLSIVANSAAEWMEALEYEFREGWKRMPAIAREIQAERNVDKVASASWLPALETARLTRPITGAELFEAYESRFQVAHSAIHSLGYLAANEDVLAYCLSDENYRAWMHYEEYGRAERRQVRHGVEAQRQLMERIESETTKALADIDKKMLSLTAEAEQLKQQSADLAQQKQRLEHQNERLEDHKQRLEEKNDFLEEEIHQLEKQIAQLEQEKETLKQQSRPLEEQNERLQRQKDRLEEHQKRLEDRNDLLEQQSFQLQQEKQQLEEQKLRLEQENNTLEQQALQLAQNAEQMGQKNVELSNTLSGVVTSKSWRVTAPLRSFTSTFKR